MDKGNYKKLKNYHVIFLVQNIMIGVGMLTLPKDISNVGYNEWLLPILIAFIANLFIIPIVLLCSKYPNDTFLVIIEKIWGKWIGKMFYIVFLLYGVIQVATVCHLYLRLVQSVTLPEYVIAYTSVTLFFPLVLIVKGGIKSIARFCIFSFFLTSWMMFLTKWPFQAGFFVNAIPTFEVPLKEWIFGIHNGFQSFFGFGLLAFFYPYIIDQRRAFLHASIGIWITTIIYIITLLASVVYFSKWQLENLLFPVLNLFQAVRLPFVERIEVLGISLWVFLILSTSSAYLWLAKKSLDSLLTKHKNRTWHLYIVAALALLLFNGPLPYEYQLLLFDEWGIYYGYVLLFLPLILLLSHYLKNKLQKREGGVSV